MTWPARIAIRWRPRAFPRQLVPITGLCLRLSKGRRERGTAEIARLGRSRSRKRGTRRGLWEE